MVRIRLRRVGKKKQPSYRVVVADQRSPRDGRFIEMIGHYDPLTDPPTVVIKEDRALYWLSEGAQPSDPVAHMLRSTGIWDKFLGGGRGGEAAVAGDAEAGASEGESEVESEVESEADAQAA
jgi:small subunit ribosomal protein S16